jgi:transcriptional regulator GlxA family with amidase domain
MKKWNVGILVFDGVEVLDFAGPFEVFSRTRLKAGVESRRSEDEAPFRVFTMARERAPIRATGGLEILPTHGFGDVPPIDVLVVPGGFGTRALMGEGDVLAFIRAAARGATKVTSVCTGALLLARAGLLEGRHATTHWASLDLLDSLGAGVTVERGARVVDDGVVTSAGISAGIDMAFQVVETLCGREVADETAHYMEYRRPSGA